MPDEKFLKYRAKILAINTGDQPDRLTQNITVPTFRGYQAGDVIPAGTLLRDIINKEFNSTPPQPKITIQVTGDGTTNPAAGTHNVSYGADFTIESATPATGKILQSVTFDGTAITLPYTERNVIADHTIRVVFDDAPIVNHTITATAGAHGAISPSGAVTVADGGSQTFSIAPDSGYHIKDVKVDGASVGGITTYTFTNVTADHTIEAEFEQDAPDKYTITVTDTTTGISDYIDTLYPAVGSHEYGAGQTLTASAVAKTGFILTEFKVNGTDILPNTTYTFSGSETDAGQSHTISVKFEAAPAEVYHVVVADATDSSLSNYGTISPAVGSHDVAVGSSQAVTATPNTGFKIKSFKVDSTEQAIADPTQAFTYTVSGLAADATVNIIVEFEKIPTGNIYSKAYTQANGRAWQEPTAATIVLGDPDADTAASMAQIVAGTYNWTSKAQAKSIETFVIAKSVGRITSMKNAIDVEVLNNSFEERTVTIDGIDYWVYNNKSTVGAGNASYTLKGTEA